MGVHHSGQNPKTARVYVLLSGAQRTLRTDGTYQSALDREIQNRGTVPGYYRAAVDY